MLRRFAWVLILLIASSCGGFESFSAEELETTKGKSLKRLAMTCMLEDDSEIIRKYDEYHANPWPEIV